MTRSRARIALIERPINQSIEKHCCGAREHHAKHNEQKRAQRRQTICGYDERAQGERERKNCMRKPNQPKKSRRRPAKSNPITLPVFRVHNHGCSKIAIQQPSQSITRHRQDRLAVSEQDPLRFVIQKFSQRTTHFLFV
jgi:hypothetical protein